MRPQSFMQATAFYKGRDVRCHWQTAESTGGAAAAYKQRRTLPAPVYRPSTAPHRLPDPRVKQLPLKKKPGVSHPPDFDGKR